MLLTSIFCQKLVPRYTDTVTFKVGNDTLGTDPNVGKIKDFTIVYVSNGVRKVQLKKEYDTVTLG